MDTFNLGTFPVLVLVGLLWGITNPFIRAGTTGVDKIHDDSRVKKIMKELIFLSTNWNYLFPFLINQCGSVLYFLSLKYADLTLAVPVCNSLAFLFTALAGWWLGEETPNQASNIGMVMIALGLSCYLLV